MMEQNPVPCYEFGDFSIDVVRRVLRRGRDAVRIPPKIFDLLLILVQKRHQEVGKRELMKLLWPDSFVEESNLTQSVFLLRKALGQSPMTNRLILTIPGRGYRFCGELKQRGQGTSSGLMAGRPEAHEDVVRL